MAEVVAPFHQIGIAGLGLIGGSIALATRRILPNVSIVGFDPGEDPAIGAVVDERVDALEGLAAADLIVVCSPLAKVPEVLQALARTRTTALVTDVGSTKRMVMAAALHAGLQHFVGGHPMAGSEEAGLKAARSDLFAGRPWLLVRGAAGEAAERRLTQFVEHLGGIPRWMEAHDHDRTVAYVSHLPQLVAAALMTAADGAVSASGPDVAGKAFTEMTRLASSPAAMWETVLRENADFVREALDRFCAELPPAGAALGEWAKTALDQSGHARTRWRSRSEKRL